MTDFGKWFMGIGVIIFLIGMLLAIHWQAARRYF